MRIFVTKYALTAGVYECQGSIEDNMAVVKWPGGLNGKHCFFGEDWHVDKETAESRVSKMIDAKRRSLEKQLAKLDKLEDAGIQTVKK